MSWRPAEREPDQRIIDVKKVLYVNSTCLFLRDIETKSSKTKFFSSDLLFLLQHNKKKNIKQSTGDEKVVDKNFDGLFSELFHFVITSFFSVVTHKHVMTLIPLEAFF